MGVRWAGTIACDRNIRQSAAGARAADPGEQIAALQKIKRSLSPAERKLDSRLAVDSAREVAARSRSTSACARRTRTSCRGC